MGRFSKILLLGMGLSLAMVGTAMADRSVSIRIGGTWGGGYYSYPSYSYPSHHYESHSYYGPGQTFIYERYVPAPHVRSYSYRSYPRPYARYPHHKHYSHRSYSNRYDRYCR